MSSVFLIPAHQWSAGSTAEESRGAADILEGGGILLLEGSPYALDGSEHRFLSPAYVKKGVKNISFDPGSGTLSGARCPARERQGLCRMLDRFARTAIGVVSRVLPGYAGALGHGRSSLRPVEVRGRASSRRRDDTLLHVDAFPSRPTGGHRILRVFSNVNPGGEDRVWRTGDSFESVAEKFLPLVSRPSAVRAHVLRWLGATTSQRTPYDHAMLEIHNLMKEDDEYQRDAGKETLRFSPGSTWMVFTDLVSHAALAGQHVLEQTLYLPVRAMADESRSPLRVLERIGGVPMI